MGRVLKYSFCLLLALVYVFSYMGFGIHTCHEDGSRHLVLLFGEVSCEAIHHHSHDADHDHHHDDGCCSTQVFVLTDAQDDYGTDLNVGSPDTALTPVIVTKYVAVSASAAIHAIPSRTPPRIPCPSTSLLSVWLI